MLTLKDIKISRTRIPVQNAIWLRPVGGLKFKIYYPHGGSWAELGTTDSGSDPDSGSDDKGDSKSKTIIYKNGETSRKSKVVVCKAISVWNDPKKTRYSYFFADGRLKIKSNGGVYLYNAVNGEYTNMFTKKGTIPKNFGTRKWHKPMLVTQLTKEEYEELGKIQPEPYHYIINRDGSTMYFTAVIANTLTCSTTSPYFKIENGYLKCIKQSKLPEGVLDYIQAQTRADKFIVFRWKKRGKKMYINRPFLKASATTIRARNNTIRQGDNPYWHSLGMLLQRKKIKRDLMVKILYLKLKKVPQADLDLMSKFKHVRVIEIYKHRKALETRARLMFSKQFGTASQIKKGFLPETK